MQRSIFRPILNSIVLRKHFFRTAALAKHESDVNLKSWKEIPGPACIPGIGPIQCFPGGSLHNLSGTELFQKLYSMYGPIIRLGYYRGVEPLIFLYDVDSASKILRSEDTLPYRPGFESLRYYRENRSGNYKQVGLLADQGESWKKFRSTVNPIMLQPKTVKLYAKELDEVAQEMVERIRTFKNDEYKIKNKLNKELNLWSLESIGVVALGCRTGCIRSNISENSPEKRLTDCVEVIMPLISKLDFRPNLWKFVSTPNFRMAMKLLKEHETWAKYFIDQSRENLKNKPKNDDEKSVLEKLLEINEQVAYAMATDMLIAGGDAMVHTVINSLYLLAVNPEKQHKLREELKSDHENKYLKACLKESMRVMPIAGGNIRKTSKAYNILGYKIPEGANIAFMHHEMCMMDEHFKQSKKFIPERWITDKDDPISAKNPNIFAFAPFGYGSRSCVGRRIAELQLHTFLARFVENFHVEWKGPPPKIVHASINYTKEPYNFTFHDLKQ